MVYLKEMNNPKLIFYAGSQLLEGPVWDERNQVLYFVSIFDCLIYKFNPKDGSISSFKTDSPVGCIAIEPSGTLLEAEINGIYRIDLKTGSKEFIVQPNKNSKLRFNDGKLDPKGRFLVGTMEYTYSAPNESCLYSIENKKYKPIINGTTISNGLAFSADGMTLYYIDSPTKKVGKYKYDVETGDAVFDKYIIDVDSDGVPDGMCIDKKGMLWIAEWGGGRICKWDPNTGQKLKEIEMPGRNVTSCCFFNDKQLFVTTGKSSSEDDYFGGGLFLVDI